MTIEPSYKQRTRTANDQAANVIRLAYGNTDFEAFQAEFSPLFPTSTTLDSELIERLYACVKRDDELAYVLTLLEQQPVVEGFIVTDDRAAISAFLFILQGVIAFEQSASGQWTLGLEPHAATGDEWAAVQGLLLQIKPYLQGLLPSDSVQ